MSSSHPLVQESRGPDAGAATPLVLDQAALNFTQSQAGTSYANSLLRTTRGSTICNDESRVSAYSYNTGRDANKFREEVEGRMFNVLSETYFLPTDDDEWTRLNKQHVAITLGLSNHLYPAPEVVKAVLRPEPRNKRRILDLGCGTGAWTVEMARQFPEADVIGVDLAPVPVDPDAIPSNCRFEIDDINLRLAHFRGEFDLIHCRMIATGIQDFNTVALDIENCLRPGGMIIWIDVDFDMYSNDQYSYRQFATEENPSGSWFQRIAYEVRRGAVNRGSDLYTAAAELDAGFWSHEMLDPETCKTASMYLPLGPWAQCRNPAQTQLLVWTGALIKQSALSVHRAMCPVLVKSGWPLETVEEWCRKADEELDGSREPLWARIMLAWGRKREAPNRPAPALQLIPPTVTEASVPYPNYYEYDTAEHSQRQAAIRNRQKEIPLPPLPPSLDSPP